MFNVIFISLIIIYFTTLIICAYSIVYLGKNYKDYGTKLIALLIGLIIFIFGVIYSTFFVLALMIYYSDEINILFWKITILSGLGGLAIVVSVFSFFKEYKKIPHIIIIPYTILFGFILGYLFFPSSIPSSSLGI